MYLVELGSGRDELYRSAEELTAAIRRGDIGPQARIYHRTSCQWLPITAHPEFKRYAAERATARAARKQWTFLRDPSANEPALAELGPFAEVAKPSEPARNWRRALESAFKRLAPRTH